MKTFKEFIEERIRTPEQGEKLLKYIRRRQIKYTKDKSKMPLEGEIATNQTATYDSDIRDHPDEYKRRKVKAKIRLMRDAQGFVGIDTTVGIMKAMHRGEKLPPVQLSPQYDGTNSIVDGHHRTMAARLLGHKTISAEVNRPK